MNILNNIVRLMQKKNINQKELCNLLGLKQQAFTDWKSGKSTSYQKYLPQIADILGVSVDYLLGKPIKTEMQLTAHEKKLIESYRKNTQMQSAVDKLLGIERDLSQTKEVI